MIAHRVRTRRAVLALAIAGAGVLCAAAATAQPADLVAVNGKVFTARDGEALAQGFAVTGDKFIAVGSTEAMRAHVGANTRVIDLGGRFVTPGLADGHFHNEGGGRPGAEPERHAVLDFLDRAQRRRALQLIAIGGHHLCCACG